MTYTDCPIVDAPSGTSRCQPVLTTTYNLSTPPDDRADKNRRRRKERLHLPVTGARAIQRIGRRTGRRTLVEKRQPIHDPLVRPLARELQPPELAMQVTHVDIRHLALDTVQGAEIGQTRGNGARQTGIG